MQTPRICIKYHIPRYVWPTSLFYILHNPHVFTQLLSVAQTNSNITETDTTTDPHLWQKVSAPQSSQKMASVDK